MKRQFKVISPLTLEYGTHTRCDMPTHVKKHQPSTLLILNDEACNGNVWFIDNDGARGKIMSGSVSNLVKRGIVVPVQVNESDMNKTAPPSANADKTWNTTIPRSCRKIDLDMRMIV